VCTQRSSSRRLRAPSSIPSGPTKKALAASSISRCFREVDALRLCSSGLTAANANVFYELGVRHGIRPYSTVLTFAQASRLPFDVAPLRGLPYRLNARGIPRASRRGSSSTGGTAESLPKSGRRQSVILTGDRPAASRHRAAQDRPIPRRGGILTSSQGQAVCRSARRRGRGAHCRTRA
jgi:hypothetical protein